VEYPVLTYGPVVVPKQRLECKANSAMVRSEASRNHQQAFYSTNDEKNLGATESIRSRGLIDSKRHCLDGNAHLVDLFKNKPLAFCLREDGEGLIHLGGIAGTGGESRGSE
jgi:hypothetical protein